MPTADPRARPAARGRRHAPAVYRRRRLAVLGTAIALVFAVGRLLVGSSDGRDPAPSAQQASAEVPAAAASSATPSGQAAPSSPAAATSSAAPAPVDPATAQPQGTCTPADVIIEPNIAEGTAAGQDVPINLALSTRTTLACSWRVSPSTVAVSVRAGGKPVWTTGQCPGAVPTVDVVLRRGLPTQVTLTWNARRSDEGCSNRTTWVLPGPFTVAAAALGGEPSANDFTLVKPAPRTVEVTISPAPSKGSTPVN